MGIRRMTTVKMMTLDFMMFILNLVFKADFKPFCRKEPYGLPLLVSFNNQDGFFSVADHIIGNRSDMNVKIDQDIFQGHI